MAFEQSEDAMVEVAALVSRVEALVVASMLEAAGVLVHVGGGAHASVAINSASLGGHRLWVPVTQHLVASEILLEVLGDEEWVFSFGLRRSVLRVAGIWGAACGAISMVGIFMGALPTSALLMAPLSALTIPVNPQGRGDYNLHPDAGADVPD